MKESFPTGFASAARWLSRFLLVHPGREALASCPIPAPLPQNGREFSCWEREYAALVEDTRGLHLDLWESAYRLEGHILLNETTLAVTELYESWGLAPDSGLRQIGDHLGFLLSFSAWLWELAESAPAPLGEEARRRRDGFLSGHALFLTERVLAALEALRETHPEYVRIPALLESFAALLRQSCPAALTQPREEAPSPELAAWAKTLPPPEGFLPLSAPPDGEEHVIPTSGRNNCGGRCVIKAFVKKGCVLKLSSDLGDGAAPCSRACVRGRGYRQTFLSSQRLRYPLKRVGERGEADFVRISWEEALDFIEKEWRRITAAYGPGSRYSIYATGVSALVRPSQLVQRLMALDGGFLDSYNSYSSACTGQATPYTYGTGISGSSSCFLTQSKLILLWGHNPAETMFGSTLTGDLLRAKRAGAIIISVDPRYTDTAAALADEWIPLRPTTDSALMDAMAYVILSEGLEDRAFMDKFCLGFDADHMPEGYPPGENYEDYVFGRRDGVPKTPRWAEPITGVPAETIARLARLYATSKPAALLQGLGPQRNSNGEQTARSSTLLACLTGNVGIPGGHASGNAMIAGHPAPGLPKIPNPYPLSIPTFLWTDAITRGLDMERVKDGLKGGERLSAPIKMIFNLAGDTLINQHSDVNRTMEILKDTSLCECIVASDLFMTPSARFADILLPATSMLEGENITTPWREGDFLLYNNRAVEPLFECRFEYDWLRELAARLGYEKEFTAGNATAEDWCRTCYEALRQTQAELPEYAEFQRAGGYQYREPARFIAFREQIEDFEHHKFPTPSGKIEIFSPRLYDMGMPEEIPAIPRYVPGFESLQDPLSEKYPIQLIGWHTKRRTHSIHDQNSWMEEVEEPTVWINPRDAAARNVADGALTDIWNDRGRIRLKARLTHRVMPGVIAIAQGLWFTPDKDGVDIRGCINTLTTQRPTPLAKGNPQHSNLVEFGPAPAEGGNTQ